MRCEVLVVGGGPAGLAAGIALRLRGLDVLIADGLKPPIDKACGEGLMPDSLDALSGLGITIPPGLGGRFQGIAFLAEHARVAASFPRGRGIGICRTELHSLLATRAAELGVRIAWGFPVSLLPERQVRVGRIHCHYEYLIGADGQQSSVRRWSGLDEGATVIRRFGRRVHLDLPSPGQFPLVEVHWASFGQAYVTPVGTRRICIATVARDPAWTVPDAIGQLPALKERIAGSTAVARMRGSITTTRRLRHVARDNIALIGDASGSADAVTGEGLALSFRQALLSAEAIMDGDMTMYDTWHPKILCQPRRMSRVILALDRSPWLRHHALEFLARNPRIFSGLLAWHVGAGTSGTQSRGGPLGHYRWKLESGSLGIGARVAWNLLRGI